MTVVFRDATRWFLISLAACSVGACGGAGLNSSGKKPSGAADERLAAAQMTDGCLKLGNPGQYPRPLPPPPLPPPPPPGKPPVVTPPIITPPPGPCVGAPIPGQVPPPCTKACPPPPYPPVDIGREPPPFPPVQMPRDPLACGKGGIYCDAGGPIQWPGQTIGGLPYDRAQVAACFAAFRNLGYNPQGQWGIDVRKINNVSVMSQSVIQDVGIAPAMVIIDSVSVLGGLHYELLNPNALYCIQSVSVLEQVSVTSCLSSNVVFGSDVNVLSNVAARVVPCPL